MKTFFKINYSASIAYKQCKFFTLAFTNIIFTILLLFLLFVVLFQFVVRLQFTLVDPNTTVDLTQYINVDSLSCMFSPLFTNQRLRGANKTSQLNGFISHATPRVKGPLTNFYTPHSLSPPNRVVGFVCRHVEGVDLKVAKVRSFSTNGGDTSRNKLVINSTPEQVVFENDKAVLMLPSLKPFLWLIEHYTKEPKTLPDFEKYEGKFYDFCFYLLYVLHGLECGYYKFD